MYEDEYDEVPKKNKTITIKCDSCQREINLETETEEVMREERRMGAEVQYETTGEVTCECGNEITYKKSEWEYPEGVFNHEEPAIVKGGTPITK